MNKEICVDGETYKVLHRIDVLWSGWDCDNEAWLVNAYGKIRFVASNHGGNYFENKTFLEEKIKDYKSVTSDTEKMLQILLENE